MNTQCDDCRFTEIAGMAMTGLHDEACRLLRDDKTITAENRARILQARATQERCPGFRDVAGKKPDSHPADFFEDLRRAFDEAMNAPARTATTETPSDEIIPRRKCPRCGGATERIRRTIFMRALLGSKHYRCMDCREEYLYFVGQCLSL